ncbi:rRNA maturation RNase YbeY [Patescibacteria group bacterium]
MPSVLFQTESHYPVNRKKIKKAVRDYLEKKLKGKWEVSISIIGDRRMRQLNREYRHKDTTTDVLSFCFNETVSNKTQFVEPPDKILRLGDILVSYPQVILQASEQNKLVDDMVVFLVIHGLDHLMGIHHD